MLRSFIIAVVLIMGLCRSAMAAELVDLARRAEELKNQRWGMFICWSFSTFSGREWTPGVTDAAYFKATGCDTDQWAQTAKEAGMGYILFLAKHHDGFCLWDTKTTDRKVTKAPLGRDVLAELRKSCDKHGIKLALYFSEGDWTWPGAKDGRGGGSGQDAAKEKQQLTELLSGYGPIEYMWVDHAAGTGGLSHAEFLAHCQALQPGCFIGFNHGDQTGVRIRLGEMGKPGPLDDHKAAGPHMRDAPSKDYLLAEFTYPILPKHKGGAMWFYSLPEHDGLCLPAAKLFADYQGAVKYGNIFSIDVGPDYAGRLRDIDVKTLREVGGMIRNPPPPAIASLPLSQGKAATASDSWSAEYAPGNAVDGDESTRWGAANGSLSGWLEVDLGQETSIGRAVVIEASFPRTREFAIEWKSGDTWKALHHGTTIAGRQVYDFKPVTARRIRLTILKADEVPTIDEFQVFAPGVPLPAALEQARQEELRKMERTQWFRDAKFGMFICWGLYSVPGGIWKGQVLKHTYGEWIEWALPIPHAEYAAIADTWMPDKFDADAWVKTAKDAGMKYLLLTAKFHDGFLMYPSKITAYNIVDRTPWKRDPVKELAEACARQGLTFGVYWNQAYDWQHPDAITPDAVASKSRNFDRYLDDVCLPQLKEMLTNYPQISFIWFDQARSTPEMTPERSKRFADLIHALRPNLIFNSRLGAGGFHDFRSMGDNDIPPAVVPGVWETAATINHTWGYKATDEDWKSSGQIIFNLVDIVSKGGNYILNVGPMGDGRIPQPSLDVLAGVGAWTTANGEAVYGAGPTPFGDELGSWDPEKKDTRGRKLFNHRNDWRCTVKPADWSWGKPGTLYFHLFTWPDGRFELPGMKGRVVKASLLADPSHTALAITTSETRTSVTLPGKPAGAVAPVLCVEVE